MLRHVITLVAAATFLAGCLSWQPVLPTAIKPGKTYRVSQREAEQVEIRPERIEFPVVTGDVGAGRQGSVDLRRAAFIEVKSFDSGRTAAVVTAVTVALVGVFAAVAVGMSVRNMDMSIQPIQPGSF